MTRIMAVAGDAGGAAALLPVLRALAARPGLQLRLCAYRQAITIWFQLGLPIELLPDNAPADPSTWSATAAVDLVLTGTSVNGVNHERAVVRWATGAGVPSVSVLDFWSNYGSRFRDAPHDPLELPTTIAVMDEHAKHQMLAEGFPAGRLAVTGQPAIDEVAAFRALWSEPMRSETRRELCGDPRDPDVTLVLFASQPLVEMARLSGAESTPIDERAVLHALVASLEAIAATQAEQMVLVVRPHPREHLELADLPTSRRVRVVLSGAAGPWAAALAADVVVAMTSVFALEAALLGCTVVSVQPGHQRTDPLPAPPGGKLMRVYELPTLTRALRCALSESRVASAGRSSAEASPRTATDNVVDLIVTLLAGH